MNYESVRAIVRAPILTWKGFIALALFGPVLLGVQSCTVMMQKDEAIRDKNETVTAKDVRCSVSSIASSGKMQLRCPAKGVNVLTDPQLALDYTLSPRPITCVLYQGSAPTCKLAKTS